VPARIDEAAIIVLAVQLDERGRQLAQQRHAHRLVVDEGLAPAVGAQRALEDQRLARLDFDIRAIEGRAHRSGKRRELERGNHARLVLARADEAVFRAVAQHQAQRIEQDRLARARFAGEHPQPAAELQLERLDQHDVADGQARQHGSGDSLADAPRRVTRTPRFANSGQPRARARRASGASGGEPR
jgi:hypothetical protein